MADSQAYVLFFSSGNTIKQCDKHFKAKFIRTRLGLMALNLIIYSLYFQQTYLIAEIERTRHSHFQ
jgi:hypothetical protein